MKTLDPIEVRMKARLVELREGRETFIADAQRQLAALDAAIGELSNLLDPKPTQEPAQQNGMAEEAVPADAAASAVA